MSGDDKKTLLAMLRDHLATELERSTRIARDAADAVTHEDNRPEGDKDMRSTEASYVARGQSERVREIEHAMLKLAAMPLRNFSPDDSIEVSALIDVENEKGTTTYWLVPAAGGERLALANRPIVTLTTTSPLGRALLGLVAGDDAEVATPQGMRSYAISRVR